MSTRLNALGLVGLYTAFGLLLAVCDARSRDLVVHNDKGGEIAQYQAKRKALTSRDTVRIAGFCDSSCTLLAQRGPYHVCAMPGALLRFHMPYSGYWADSDTVVAETGPSYVKDSQRDWARLWLGRYNDKLNRILADATAKGRIPNPSISGDNNSVFTVRAADVLPTCK